jgi:hypothetical protein
VEHIVAIAKLGADVHLRGYPVAGNMNHSLAQQVRKWRLRVCDRLQRRFRVAFIGVRRHGSVPVAGGWDVRAEMALTGAMAELPQNFGSSQVIADRRLKTDPTYDWEAGWCCRSYRGRG